MSRIGYNMFGHRIETNCHVCNKTEGKYYDDICYKCNNQCCYFDRSLIHGKTICSKCIKEWLS